jgi:hypothetical protein
MVPTFLPQFLGAFSQGQIPTNTGKFLLLALTENHKLKTCINGSYENNM